MLILFCSSLPLAITKLFSKLRKLRKKKDLHFGNTPQLAVPFLDGLYLWIGIVIKVNGEASVALAR